MLDVGRSTHFATAAFCILPSAIYIPRLVRLAAAADYRTALHAGDSLDWRPLMKSWQQRFEQFSDSRP
jgi:hypothetical protein